MVRVGIGYGLTCVTRPFILHLYARAKGTRYACQGMVRVTSKIPVRVRVRDQKQISRDSALASELVQADIFKDEKNTFFYISGALFWI